MSNTFRQNDSDYTITEVKVKNTTYKILVISGKFNYINVKMSKNVGLGKEFKNFDEAQAYYKNPLLKAELLKVERSIV